jgi:Lrp/AsnC family leucine-responsive transcriptional regulator
MPAYQALVQRLFTQDANVRQVKAYFSVMRAKFEPAIGLPDAAQARVSSASPVR